MLPAQLPQECEGNGQVDQEGGGGGEGGGGEGGRFFFNSYFQLRVQT